MKVLVIGSGGREHALVWKLRQSPSVTEVYCAPGNAGIAIHATLVPIQANDIRALVSFVKEQAIDLTVVGPEQPLVDGIVDEFAREGMPCFGPSRQAARLEGSKVFAKEFMARHGIPTAKSRSFGVSAISDAGKFLAELGTPVVIKADGLAAGKGVLICDTTESAKAALGKVLEEKEFGDAGNEVVIEEYLSGEEASVFAIADGDRYALLTTAQDHKRIFDGDQGKNTGGMGAYAPAPIMTQRLLRRVRSEIVEPTLQGMKAEGNPYRGCLYVGLMVTADGPKVLEYNCRFGDPETQAVLPLVDGDLARILMDASTGNLDPTTVGLHPASAVCVVMASRGYPDRYETGKPIRGLDSVSDENGEIVFHAGTRRRGSDIVTSGGRVLGVTAIGREKELEGTISMAYAIVHRIAFDGAYYRSDIGKKALKHLGKTP